MRNRVKVSDILTLKKGFHTFTLLLLLLSDRIPTLRDWFEICGV